MSSIKIRASASAGRYRRLVHTVRRFYLPASSSSLPTVQLWIGGQSLATSSGGTVVHTHPKTGRETCQVVVAGEKEVNDAIMSSKTAFEGWRDVTGWEKKGILQNVGNLIKDRSKDLEEALRADSTFSDLVVKKDQESALHLLDGASHTAISVEGTIPQTVDGSFSMVLRQPYGPVLSIPAFNYPLTLALRSIAYPLACGNTVLLRASPLLFQLFQLLGPLFQDAGLPKGALQILHFSEKDVAERIEQIIAHRDVRMVNFTGSVKLGKILAAKCGQYLKPSVMELGGKSVAIVLPTADLELAANNILFGAFFNSGQVCMSTEQLLVHSEIANEFEKVLKEVAGQAKWGEQGMEMVRPGSGDGARVLYDDAIKQGAKVLYTPSNNSSSISSTSFPPTIFSSLPSSSKLYIEESFSPLLSLHRLSSTEDIIQHANSHSTGLTSSIFTNEYREALDMAKELETGAVHVNGMTIHDQHNLPHGGWKDSGYGRFNSKGAIESFTQTKNVRFVKGGKFPLGLIYQGL